MPAALRPAAKPAAKWAGLTLVLLLLALDLASIWIEAGVPLAGKLSLGVSRGAVALVDNGSTPPKAVLRLIDPAASGPFSWWFEATGIFGVGWIAVPLWFPIALAAAPTAWLWLTPRRRPGRCESCRYDRRGLPPDAPCPECGALPSTPAPPPAPRG